MLHFKYGKLLRITRQLVNTIALAIPNWLQRATRLQQAGDCFCTKLSFFPNVSQSGQARRSDRCSTSTCGFVSSKSHGYTTFSSLALYVYVCEVPASTSFHQLPPATAIACCRPSKSRVEVAEKSPASESSMTQTASSVWSQTQMAPVSLVSFAKAKGAQVVAGWSLTVYSGI